MSVELRDLKYRIDGKLYQYLKEHESPTPPGPTPPTPTPGGDFEELNTLIQNAIAGSGQLVLDKDYQFIGDEGEEVMDIITINGVIEIDGHGHTINLESPTGRCASLFRLQDENSSLVLKNTRVVNGGLSQWGASYYLIEAVRNVNIANCFFQNCNSIPGIARGVHSLVDSIIINNTCDFSLFELEGDVGQQILRNLIMSNTLTDYEYSGGLLVDGMADQYLMDSNVIMDNTPNKVRLEMYGDVINNYWGTNHVTENSINLAEYPDYRSFSYESLIINYPSSAMLRVPEAITMRFSNTSLPEFEAGVKVEGNASLDTGVVMLGGANPSEVIITPLGVGNAVFTLGTNFTAALDVHEFYCSPQQ